MMLVAGTIPIKGLPLTLAETTISEGEFLSLNHFKIPCAQGTAAVVSAALAVTNYLKLDPPQVLVVGDTGRGEGSQSLYRYLTQNISCLSPDVLELHYILPDMALMRKVCESVKACPKRPIMIADAGSMYAAKATGLSSEFDIFTPDATEMAFLADPDATHPAYIHRHLFDTDVTQTPELVSAAYRQGNTARLLLVKGAIDYIVEDGKVLETLTEPNIPALEAIGGTGDTITGLVAAFAYAGLELHKAAIIAARSNRMAGKLAQATPATRVWQIIAEFHTVFEKYLNEWT